MNQATGDESSVADDVVSAVSAERPLAVFETQEFDFGVMEPHTKGEHEFAITNQGEGELHMKEIGKTCHCVGLEIEPRVLAPGETGVVRVKWDTRFEAIEFRHGATIRTNDPENEAIKFRVNGRVKVKFGTEPARLVFDRILPGEESLRQLTVFSQEWDNFQIDEIRSSLAELEWSVKPADEALLHEHRARSGYHVIVSVPEDMPQGTFHEWLQFDVSRPVTSESESDEEHKATLEVDVHGNVIRRLSVRGGPELQYDGTVYFGTVRPESGAETRLMIQVRDQDKELIVKDIKVTPDFLHAELKPFDGISAKAGMYYLDVAVPAGQRRANHLGLDAGKIVVEFDHPRVEPLQLFVQFAYLHSN